MWIEAPVSGFDSSSAPLKGFSPRVEDSLAPPQRLRVLRPASTSGWSPAVEHGIFDGDATACRLTANLSTHTGQPCPVETWLAFLCRPYYPKIGKWVPVDGSSEQIPPHAPTTLATPIDGQPGSDMILSYQP
jgi:hypothetical protein